MFKKTLLRKKCLVIFNELKICNFNTNIGIYKKNFRIIEGDYFRIILKYSIIGMFVRIIDLLGYYPNILYPKGQKEVK